MKNKEKIQLKQLIKDFKSGNNKVIDKLYNQYSKVVYGIAFSILKNRDDAEDIVQIVFSKLLTLDKNKLPKNNEATWLYTVTKNETLQLLKNRSDTFDIETIYEIQDSNNQIEELIDKETYNNLINKLNDKEKEIVSLKIIANLSFNEISELLGEKVGTVKWRYYKSIYTLRLLLSNLGMFILTFVLGIFTLKNTKKSIDNEIKQEIGDIEENTEVSNIDLEDATASKIENVNVIIDQTEENIITEETVIDYTPNYLGYGILSISSIFLILTIVFAIILTKYQPNYRKKSSK